MFLVLVNIIDNKELSLKVIMVKFIQHILNKIMLYVEMKYFKFYCLHNSISK